MKTINGNNKLERQINKALKYNELVLIEDTKKYLKVAKGNVNKTFFVGPNSVKFGCNQYGEYAMIRVDNLDKPIFIKPGNITTATDGDGSLGGYYIYMFRDTDAAKLEELTAGDDGVLKLNNELVNRFRIRRN